MNFDNEVRKLLKEFNVFPQYQSAPSTGPDQGMTSGDMQNTFPQRMDMIKVDLPNKKKFKKTNQRSLKRNVSR